MTTMAGFWIGCGVAAAAFCLAMVADNIHITITRKEP